MSSSKPTFTRQRRSLSINSMLSFLGSLSSPSATPTTPTFTPEQDRLPRKVTGIVADASKYEVTIVRYVAQETEDDAAATYNELRVDCRGNDPLYDQDWDEDAEEWMAPDFTP